jgi:hypothetical protein
MLAVSQSALAGKVRKPEKPPPSPSLLYALIGQGT